MQLAEGEILYGSYRRRDAYLRMHSSVQQQLRQIWGQVQGVLILNEILSPESIDAHSLGTSMTSLIGNHL